MSKRGFTPAKQSATVSSRKYRQTGKQANGQTATKPFPQTSSFRLIRPALVLLKRNAITSAFIYVLPGLLSYFGSILSGGSVLTRLTSSTDDSLYSGLYDITWLTVAGTLLTGIASCWLILNIAASYYLQVRVAHGKTPGPIECYRRSFRYLPRIAGLTLLITTLILLTAILIFPVFIFIRRYIFAAYFLVDGDTGIREAMQRSAAATKPVRWYVWSTLLLTLIPATLGMVLIYYWEPYGPFFALLVSCLLIFMPAVRYREIAIRKSATTVK